MNASKSASRGRKRIASCGCGGVALEADGDPIVAAACYCTSCQEAGRKLETLEGAPAILNGEGGTAFVLQRKDRVHCLRGQDMLREFRLTPTSSTRRVVAACCNAPMFLEFTGGHWLSLYLGRFPPADPPALEMRTMTRDRRQGVEFSDGLPGYRTHSGRFMWRLLSAWVAMGFRAPKIDYVKGALDGVEG